MEDFPASELRRRLLRFEDIYMDYFVTASKKVGYDGKKSWSGVFAVQIIFSTFVPSFRLLRIPAGLSGGFWGRMER